jgi:hypothetical protein
LRRIGAHPLLSAGLDARGGSQGRVKAISGSVFQD